MSLRRLLLIAFFLLMAVIFARYFSHRAKYGLDLSRPRRIRIAQVDAARTGSAPPAVLKPQSETRSGTVRVTGRDGGLTLWPG